MSLLKKVRTFFQFQNPKERIVIEESPPSNSTATHSDIQRTSYFASLELSGQFRQVFEVIDSNGDGKISIYELSEVLSCLGREKPEADVEAEKMVKEMDCDGDGFIDLDEFMGVVNENGKNEKEEEDFKDAFLMFDEDGNGLISARELQKVLIGLGICNNYCSLKDCKKMIRGFDRDGDGFVDFQEFVSMMKANASRHQIITN